jgi:hypothetical protein
MPGRARKMEIHTLMSILTNSFALWGVLLTEMRYRVGEAIVNLYLWQRSQNREWEGLYVV